MPVSDSAPAPLKERKQNSLNTENQTNMEAEAVIPS